MRRRLLERVLDDRFGVGVEDTDSVRRSVLESLRRIFRTGQGDASIDLHYGLPDVGAICRNLPEAAEQMREAIAQAIERYEPRLRRVRVVPRPDAGGRVLHYDIVAELSEGEPRADRRFKATTRLEASGHLVVEG
jgi:type VI secretion system protein